MRAVRRTAALHRREAEALTAVGAGTATLAAAVDSRSDTAQVTVVAGTEFAMGTTLWQLDAPSGGTVSDWLPLQRVAPEVPDLVVTLDDGDDTRSLAFLQADGTRLYDRWRAHGRHRRRRAPA